MTRNILITGIGGQLGLSVLKRVTNMDFTNIYGCDIDNLSLGAMLVDKFFIVPKAHQSKYLREIVNLVRHLNLSHIFVTTESEIRIISNHLNLFTTVKLIMNNNLIADIFLDKYKTSYFLEENGFPTPKSYTVDDKITKGLYIVKLNKSSGSKLVQVFEDIKEISYIRKTYTSKELIIQDYIKSDLEYTATVFSDGRIYNTIIFKRKITGGITYLVNLEKDDFVTNELIRLAKLVNLRGSLNIQYKKSNNNVFIFEVNPRVSGSTMFKYKLGFDEIGWWINMLDGENIKEFNCEYEKVTGVIEITHHLINLE
jgi:carbamoyl-phosphate synthase large subunit